MPNREERTVSGRARCLALERKKSNGINALCAFCEPTEFNGDVAGVWGCERPGSDRATWKCRRGPRQEKVDGNGFPPLSMASDSFRLNVKGINRCDACKQLLLVKLFISGCIYLQTFCRDMRREFAAAACLSPKILPTYPLEGCPLLREYLIVEGGRKRQIL